MAKEAYYFSHDSNARHDPKVTAMRSVYGAEGYAFYWILIEMMREQDGYKLDMRSKYAFHAFASQMQCDQDKAQCFIQDCVSEFELFASDGESFWSESLMRRMKEREGKSEKARKSAEARWKKGAEKPAPDKDSSTDANRTECDGNANASKNDALKERKVKEIKLKEIKDIKNIYAENVSLTSIEYQKLIDEHGEGKTKRMIQILDNYKGANGKKYKSDYRAILNWVVDRVNEEVQRATVRKGPENLNTGIDFGF